MKLLKTQDEIVKMYQCALQKKGEMNADAVNGDLDDDQYEEMGRQVGIYKTLEALFGEGNIVVENSVIETQSDINTEPIIPGPDIV